MIVRVKKRDAAYFYQILESYDGLTNFSTEDHREGDTHRRVILHFAPDLKPILNDLLRALESEISLEILSA